MPYTDATPRWPRATLLALALVPAGAVSGGAEPASQAAMPAPDAPHGMVLYLKHCASCHRRNAWGDGPREIPALAGQHAGYLMAQLTHFVEGGRQGSELHGPVMHETLQPPDVNRAQALRDLAAWLSQSLPNREPEHGEGQALAAGKRAYGDACASCHGDHGEGRESPVVPALASQHYSYLLARIRSFSAGHVVHAPGLGPGLAGPTEQQQSLADYASRLTPAGSHTE